MEAQIYDITGKSSSKVKLPENLFGLSWNADLVHQVATSLATNKRKPVAHTKDRGEVRGGGKKPWRQKGTGRARHGSTRSPIWVGGGVTHGPRNEKNFARTVSRKMRLKALYVILSRKYKDGEVLFVDTLAMKEPKTKMAVSALKGLSQVKGFEKLSTKKKNAAVIALSAKSASTERSMQNIGSVEVMEIRNLNPLTLLNHKFVVIENPAESLKNLPGHAKE
ncbi:50S ribosomal protein L4 [Candidatus Parcubacteria bacterium]|nr:50S ribosomal protein L4 [Candidatus Parcubacteria bacterium]